MAMACMVMFQAAYFALAPCVCSIEMVGSRPINPTPEAQRISAGDDFSKYESSHIATR